MNDETFLKVVDAINEDNDRRHNAKIRHEVAKRKQDWNVPSLQTFHRTLQKHKSKPGALSRLAYDFMDLLIRADLIHFNYRYLKFPRVDWDFYKRKAKPAGYMLDQRRLRKSFVYVARLILNFDTNTEFLEFYSNLVELFPDQRRQKTSLTKLERNIQCMKN